MAEIAPFRGLLYNQKMIPGMDDVITPPYDVISRAEQEMYYRRHPYNIVRLILGRNKPDTSGHEDWQKEAAATFQAWKKEGILVLDPLPAIYDYEMSYREPPNKPKTRQGFICLVRLQDFSQGSVRPHERTYEGIKSERLKLMCSCNANLSQVFALYADPGDLVTQHLQQGREDRSVFDFTDKNGIGHRMWRVTRSDAIQQAVASMRDKPLFIADGHHRYETALKYQTLMQTRYPDRGRQASFNYILMYLSNMTSPGLSILPAHRMFLQLPQFRIDSFLTSAEDYFEIVPLPFDAVDRDQTMERLLSALQSAGERNVIGLYAANSSQFVLLKLRTDVNHESWRGQLPRPLQTLDVVVLNELVLKRLLKVDDNMLDDENTIQYCHDALEAIEQVDRGPFRLSFLLSPTRIEQVQEVASSGLIMPHKSTYFYPKVVTGSVLNPLDPDKDVPI